MKFPHPLALLCGCVLLAAVASHVLPAGEYDRRDDPATGRRVVVAGTYHAVAARPVGAFQTLVAIPRGMADAAAVIFFVFLIGGAFTVVDETGALRQGVDSLVRQFGHSDALVVPAASLAFALGGVLDNMKEEIIALVPVTLLLVRRLGYRPVVAVAMSLGAAAVGAAFSPINPFQVGIAQQLAQLPLLSGSLFRLAFLAAALGIWIWGTSRYAARTRGTATTAPDATAGTLDARRGAVLALVLVTFAALVFGALRLRWGFNEMAALFFVMGVVAGLVGGLGVGGTAAALVAGFRSMAYAALLIGFARAIFVTLEEGRIVDTIVHGLFAPVAQLPVALAALGMMVVHGLVHVPVPSPSGHAVLTLPILVPLADLLGLSRQVTVLAYQYGLGSVRTAPAPEPARAGSRRDRTGRGDRSPVGWACTTAIGRRSHAGCHGGRGEHRPPHRPAARRLRPGVRSQGVARHRAVGIRPRPHPARGVVAPGPAPPQHLGDPAAHGLLEVHRAPPADARSRTRIPSRREQLAGAPRETRRGRVAARRRTPQGAASAAPGGHRAPSRGAAQRPRSAIQLDQRAACVWHRLP